MGPACRLSGCTRCLIWTASGACDSSCVVQLREHPLAEIDTRAGLLVVCSHRLGSLVFRRSSRSVDGFDAPVYAVRFDAILLFPSGARALVRTRTGPSLLVTCRIRALVCADVGACVVRRAASCDSAAVCTSEGVCASALRVAERLRPSVVFASCGIVHPSSCFLRAQPRAVGGAAAYGTRDLDNEARVRARAWADCPAAGICHGARSAVHPVASELRGRTGECRRVDAAAISGWIPATLGNLGLCIYCREVKQSSSCQSSLLRD